jgi:adenylate cyclase
MIDMNKAGKIKILKGRSSREIISRIIFFGIILIVLIMSTICVMNAIQWVNKPFAGFLINERMVLGNVGQYHWTGTRAGLKFPDKILKADGKVISSMRDLEEVVNNTKTGDIVTYSVERGGKIIEIGIPTMRFTLTDIFMTFGVTFLSGIIYLLIGVVVFIMKPDTRVSWAFFLACSFLSIFAITSFDIQSTHYGFIHVYLFVNTLFPAAFIHLSLVFPEKRRIIERYPYLQFLPYIFSTILILQMEFSYPQPSFMATYQFVRIYTVISALAMITSTLYAFFKKSTTIARQRAKVVLFGAALAFPIPALAHYVSLFGSNVIKVTIENNFLAIPIALFPASVGYAIAKHNLFDVDLYIKRAVGYSIMIALVVMSEVSLDLLSNKVLSQMLGEYAKKAFPIFFALLIVLFFNPVYHKVRECVDKCFFRKKFDYKETVLSVSDALTSVLNLDEIIKKIINTVRKEMFIDTAGVVLVDPQQKCCRTVFVGDKPGNIEDRIKDVCIPCDDPLLALVAKEKKMITKYDIDEDPHYLNLKESCGQRFSEMGASMLMPIIYQDEVKGALALGYKKSGHFYTREDIDLLETLTNHGAIAIENARLAEQMKEEITVRTDLARYISPQVVEQIIKKDRQVNLGEDKKIVTVLISDIRNFTKITENYPPDQLVKILNEYFTEMAKIIFENQGSLDKYIGDAIVAVFGSLIPLENSAEFAVRAAAQMMKRMTALNERWAGQYGLVMNIGIGINTGEVFLGNVGSPERMEFTVIGDTVNVTSRLSDLARAGQILITRDTLSLIGADIKYKELPLTEVKGKTGKLEVFEILYS